MVWCVILVQLLRALLQSQTHHKQESSASSRSCYQSLESSSAPLLLSSFSLPLSVLIPKSITAVATPIKVPATNTEPTSVVRDHASAQIHTTATVIRISATITSTAAPVMSTKLMSDIQVCVIMGLDHLWDTVTPQTVPITHTVVLVTNTQSMLVVRVIVLGLGHQAITATTVIAHITNIAIILAINTGSMSAVVQTHALVSGLPVATVTTLLAPITNTMVLVMHTGRMSVVRAIVLGLGHSTITATTRLAQSTPISVPAISTGSTSVQTIALVSGLVATVTTLLVPITNTLVLAIYTSSMLVVRVIVPGLGHQTIITATTLLAQSTPISVHAISTGSTSVQTIIALVSSLLVATVTTLLVPTTNTLVPAIRTCSMSVHRAIVRGLEHQTITASTVLALGTCICIPVSAISTEITSDIPALARVSGHLTTPVITVFVLVTSTGITVTNARSMSVV